MKKMSMPWIIPFSLVYVLALLAFLWWMIRFNTRRLARNAQRRAAEADFAVLMQEIRSQQHADEAARRILALADTLPTMPTLPALIPAWQLDASDRSDDALAYCPICALEGVTISGLRDADGYYPLPRGKRVLCSEHTVRWEQRIEGDVL